MTFSLRFLVLLVGVMMRVSLVCVLSASGGDAKTGALHTADQSGLQADPAAGTLQVFHPPPVGRAVRVDSGATQFPWRPSGRVTEIYLEVSEQVLSPAGKPVRALTVNGTVPGPVLRFREGDWARIHVRNSLKREETSVHWHGLLVPNSQDGVPHLTTPPIPPGASLSYEFPIRQSGTYWYHSHTGLQEQRGVQGAIVIEPRNSPATKADLDQVLFLSDWSNESPESVLRSLKRGSGWYALKKGTAPSLVGAFQQGALGEYLKQQKQRMPPMDVSDVAYDAFLVNGRRTFQVGGGPGKSIRLRVVNGSASTYFYVESATGPLRVVAADGLPVEPFEVKRLLMGIAETYDILLTNPPSGAWEVRATAQDCSGHASAILGEGALHAAPAIPRADPYRMDKLLQAAMDEASEDDPARGEGDGEKQPASMHGSMPRRVASTSGSRPENKPGGEKMEALTGMRDLERPLSPYRLLRSASKTAFSAHLPRRSLELHLTGDMQRYVWSFDGKTIDETSSIPVRKGEVLRLMLVNDTMMHHPIHLHGHFFRLLNGGGDFAPLKHTVDVPPMGRRTLEFEANEHGDWMFHCHILYHMMEGMARVVHYLPPDAPAGAAGLGPRGPHAPEEHAAAPVHLGEHAMPMVHAFTDFTVLNNLSEGSARMLAGKNALTTLWEVGRRRGEAHASYEAEVFYERAAGTHLGLLAGLRLSNETPVGCRPMIGGWVRLPYLVTAKATLDGQGAARMELAKHFQLTPRLSLEAKGYYDTRSRWEDTVSIAYVVSKNVDLSASYHSKFGVGAGIGLHF